MTDDLKQQHTKFNELAGKLKEESPELYEQARQYVRDNWESIVDGLVVSELIWDEERQMFVKLGKKHLNKLEGKNE